MSVLTSQGASEIRDLNLAGPLIGQNTIKNRPAVLNSQFL